MRPFVLPRTLIRMYFATKRNYFAVPVEAVGTPVDVYLPPDLMAKPVEALIPLLKHAAGLSRGRQLVAHLLQPFGDHRQAAAGAGLEGQHPAQHGGGAGMSFPGHAVVGGKVLEGVGRHA